MTKPKVAVMFSGGIDSTVLIADYLDKGYDVYPMAFDYGSVGTFTIKKVVIEEVVKHYQLMRNLSWIRMYHAEDLRGNDVFGFVPGLKMIMQISAMSYCQSYDIPELATGYNKSNLSEEYYTDELPEYIDKTTDLFNAMYDGETRVTYPYYGLSKAEVVKLGNKLDVPFEKTRSCNNMLFSGAIHCGKCSLCRWRRNAFKWTGVEDPTPYWFKEEE